MTTEPRCERTDLPVSMCSHCLGHDESFLDRPGRCGEVEALGDPFVARYPGRCAGCDSGVKVGDQLWRTKDDQGYVCAECAS